MAKEWVDGEPVPEGEIAPGDESAGNIDRSTRKTPLRRPGPNSCKPYMRKRLAKALPEIADALLKEARQGKLPELKMLVLLSGLDDKDAAPVSKRFGGRSFEEILLDDWRKETVDAAGTNANPNGNPEGKPIGNPDGSPDGHTHSEETGQPEPPGPEQLEQDQPAQPEPAQTEPDGLRE